MPDPFPRRAFVRALALGAPSALLVPAPAPATADDPPADPPRPEAEAEAPPSEADARMDLIVARYGRHLDDDAREAVRREVEGVVRRGEALREFALDNGDGPFPVFVPYRAPLGR